MGYTCLAVDQRSGGKVNGIVNQTHQSAKKLKKATAFLDAAQDMRAAMQYAKKRLGQSRRYIAWGSSYSAALVIALAAENPTFASAIIAFSPGEYFSKFGKPQGWIRKSAAKVKVPAFVTSSKKEKKSAKRISAAIRASGSIAFFPETAGNHGSRALWPRFDDSQDYWASVISFIKMTEK
jgi:dienelactone hydrolase